MAALTDAAEVDAAFEAAAEVARSLTPSTDDRLRLYGLYKQSTCGAVTTGRPYVWDVAGRAKWDAWHSHGAMKQADAKRRYVALVAELSSNGSNDGGDAAEAQAAQSIAGARVSTMACESSGGGDDDAPPLVRLAERGDVAGVRAALKGGAAVDACDGDGRAALHWAADCGSVECCRVLLEAGARVDLRDGDGLTPLAYAVICDRGDVVDLLMANGADPDVADDDGETPRTNASAEMRLRLTL